MTRTRNSLLRALLALSLCWTASAAVPGNLQVGAARLDITPPADPANPPSGKYAHERLYLRAIVLDNGSTRAALIGADQGMLSEGVWGAASKQIAAELNCPVENIVMSATHSHSAWGPGPGPAHRHRAAAEPDPLEEPAPPGILGGTRPAGGGAHGPDDFT